MGSAMWECETCETRFDSTIAAIDHALRFESADIWPRYGGDDV